MVTLYFVNCMNKLRNFLSPPGRLNRKQFIIIEILLSLFLILITTILDIIWIIFYWAENAVNPMFFTRLLIQTFIGFPLSFPLYISRGHDFGMKTIISTIFVILTYVLYISPRVFNIYIYELFGEGGIILKWLFYCVFIVYIFYPGNKKSNLFWIKPINSTNPLKIFRYMRTGSWENRL